MPLPKSTKRRDLIRRFRELGWAGPLSGGKHQFMMLDKRKQRIPNEHNTEISVNLLAEILRQAGIDEATWMGPPGRKKPKDSPAK